ncbi:MAG: glucosidase [Acidobacteria bacterium]|nr:glucosidase [Acidobacteriota bacterium]
MTAEEKRLQEARRRQVHWKRWGPYLSERAWGTVREDYSPHGTAWEYFPHDHARSKAYRWGEDGLGGISDRHQYLCFSLAMWNGRDPILKERLFGLTGNEGNHGEDVKEYYYYLDATPTHSYLKYLYKYPQAEFPYTRLVEENRRRCGQWPRRDPEFELIDTGVFDGDRYFDVFVEYAKETFEDMCIRITVANRGPDTAALDLLPTLWFRNIWSWGSGSPRPRLWQASQGVIECEHPALGRRKLFCENPDELLFTENETNYQRLYGTPNVSPYVKDAFHDYIIHGHRETVNPARTGTKAAARYKLLVGPGRTAEVRLRLADGDRGFADFERVFAARIAEADEFYATVEPPGSSEDARRVQRQAFAGLLWSKQFYYYDVNTWLKGDPAMPPPPPERLTSRNSQWIHLYNSDVISMPDKWEYPWYAAWDLAFHTLPLALVDADFAKEQLILMLREWYLHPNGQIPAYEWAFGDVNPPVHAWACWRVYKIDKKRRRQPDIRFLERAFHKLLLNFTWWVNRKDLEGNNLFQGGFLGLDNIGVFDRSAPLPTGGYIQQSDGTSWMAMYTLNMLAIAMELARYDPAYEDVASKFFEHFVWITHAMNHLGFDGMGLWDEEDGFYYDVLRLPGGGRLWLKVRSMVGLIPLFAVETLDPDLVNKLPGFRRRMEWFLHNHEDIQNHIEEQKLADGGVRRLLSVVNLKRLPRVLRYMLDENEFLSPHGVRAISRYHRENPYRLHVNGNEYSVDYEPAESTTGIFGGNSNWRGPIWFPLNYLLIESLQKFHYFTGDKLQVEFPTGSSQQATLWQVAAEISRRLNHIFLRDAQGRRPVYGGVQKFQSDPHWKDLVLFYEYFHGDCGAGLGASHQTGWTGLVAKMLQQSGE